MRDRTANQLFCLAPMFQYFTKHRKAWTKKKHFSCISCGSGSDQKKKKPHKFSTTNSLIQFFSSSSFVFCHSTHTFLSMCHFLFHGISKTIAIHHNRQNKKITRKKETKFMNISKQRMGKYTDFVAVILFTQETENHCNTFNNEILFHIYLIFFSFRLSLDFLLDDLENRMRHDFWTPRTQILFAFSFIFFFVIREFICTQNFLIYFLYHLG